MSLPTLWVDKIFEKLALIYGHEFTRRWESCGVPIADVKTDWAHELAGFANWGEAIAYGLANLPAEKPPTALQFRDICRKAPAKALPAIEAPKVDPERLKRELARLGDIRAKVVRKSGVDHKAWAKSIVARDAAGEKVRPISLRFAREALRLHLPGGEAGHA